MLTSPLPPANCVLAALPAVEYLRLLPHLELVKLVEGELLCEAGSPLQHVYFPSDCLVSMLTLVDHNQVFAVALVGREGMTSVSTALGSQISSFRALVLASGSAMRMQSKVFVSEFRSSAALRKVVLGYVFTLTEQISQTAACNRFHGIEARLARWLLMTRDRLSSNHFHMTHEMLAQLLGVRRVGVTNAANGLRLRGLIDYRRGAVAITDVTGLCAAACSCYRRLDGTPGTPGTAGLARASLANKAD